MDPRCMSAEQRLQTVLDEMKALAYKSKSKVIWSAHTGNIVRWTQILAGEWLRPVDMAGELHTLCKECGSIVWDVYIHPRPDKGICGLCCKHRKERDNRGSCTICANKDNE